MSTPTPDENPTVTPDSPDAGATSVPDEIEAQELLRQLATSIALLPQDGIAEDEEAPEGAIAIPVIEQDGTHYVPIFTSEEALRTAGADAAAAVQVPLAELAAGWPSEELWLAINPGNEDGLTLPPDGVRALASFAQGPDGAAPVAG